MGTQEIGQVITLRGKLGWAFSTIRRELQLLVDISFMPLAGWFHQRQVFQFFP